MATENVRYRWLVTDLDGTILDSRQSLVARSRKALDHFRSIGGTVLIATGRIEASARPYHHELGLHTPAILHNGARIVDLASGRTLMQRDLPETSVDSILKVVDSVDIACSVAVFSGTSAYAVEVDAALDGYAKRDGLRFVIRPDLSGMSASKVLLIAAETDQPVLLAELCQVEGTHVVQSEPTYLEVLPEGTDKGTALEWLARANSVPVSEIIAVGDGMNDLAMLEVAGLGACVADAQPDLVAAADLVVSSCSAGGVADVVELAIDGAR